MKKAETNQEKKLTFEIKFFLGNSSWNSIGKNRNVYIPACRLLSIFLPPETSSPRSTYNTQSGLLVLMVYLCRSGAAWTI